MQVRLFGAATCVVIGTWLGCQALDEPVSSYEQNEAAVVYGADDRLDYHAHPDEGLKRLTRESIVALIRTRDLERRDPDDIGLDAESLGEAFGLCDGELFRDQPTAAGCSGTLIADNLVLTAGHCVMDQESWDARKL